MKAIVTGGAGFIGSHFCDRLINDGYEVIAVDNLLTGSAKNVEHLIKNPKFKLIKHDVLKPLPDDLECDALFHLASPASPNHHSKLSYHALPLETMLVNTQGTLELLKFAENNKAKFLFASTSEVYGDPLEHPQKENYNGNVSTTGPRSVYDEAKRFGETLVAYFVRTRNLDARIARIFNTYGPRMMKDDMRMVIRFVNQALEGVPITVYGDGTQTRSLCYVDDMIEGLVRLMNYPNTKGEVVNLGSQDEHTVLEYANIIKKITDSKSEITYSEDLPEDDPKKRRPDISKAKKLINWEPKVSLEEGLKRVIKYLST
ncbi:SDR family oxidoreductase [Candidatus Roizmanbacteria bacterium]|nr:SDR family oxidoreductase [Candidatus Roizmanbacteria bacterium]